MALFGKKKLSLDEILEGIKTLSEEEKAQALAAMQGSKDEKPEITEEVEDTKVETTEGENVEGEQAEEEKAVEEVEETTEEPVAQKEEVDQPVEQTQEEDAVLEPGESATDEMANDNRDKIIHQLSDKVNELSEQIKGLLELKTLMEEYTSKQAEGFGYKGNVLGAKKDYKDMSTDELKAFATKGI
jgi:hypothetical protein